MRIYFFFFILYFSVGQLFSQQTTGILEGWILSEKNEAIANVNVSLNGPGLQGSRGVASNENGHFKIVALPVGRYTVNIHHVAYTETIYENVRIQLGKTTSLGEIILEPGSMETAVVNIIASRPVIDPTTTTSGINLDYDQISPLPLERDYSSAVALVPMANSSFYGDGVNIAGATGMENAYYVDGVNVTNPYTAFNGARLPYNFVREIEVKTGGYEAEYGSALGGVVNVLTHSGSNSLSGNAFGFFTNNKFSGERKTGVIATNVESFASYDFGASLGGPMIRDKLWYYVAYNPQFELEDIVIPRLGSYQDKLVAHIFAAKLNWKVSESSHLTFNVYGDPQRHDRVDLRDLPISDSIIENKDVFLAEEELGGYNFSLNFKSMLSEALLLESNLAFLATESNSRGTTERGRTEPLFIDEQTGTYSGGRGSIWESDAERFSVDVKASFFLKRHTIKTGFNYEDNSASEKFTETGPGNIGTIIQKSDTLYEVYTGVWDSKVYNRIPALFIQDDWQVTSRLLLKAGLRWSAEYMIGSDGKLAQRIEDEWQPRIGFVYQPGKLGQQKIYGSWGRFYEKIPNLFSSFNHSVSESYILVFDHNPLQSLAGADTIVNQSSNIVDEVKGLQGQYNDEFILGYERDLGGGVWMGIQGMYRYLGQAIEDAYSLKDDRFYIGNPGQGRLSFVKKRKREYTALQLSLRINTKSGMQAYTSYVLSRLYGNYPGLYDHDSGQFLPNTNPNMDFAEQYPNSTGLLPGDRTHVFKLWGFYPFNFGLNVGSTFMWQSGAPLNNLATLPNLDFWHAFLEKRGTAGRMPDLWDLSVRLTYNLKMMSLELARTRLIFDLLHIGSSIRAVDIDQVRYFGQEENENPNYLKPKQYQSPFTFRIGLEMVF